MNIYKSFSIYLSASIIERGLSFILLPLFTFYLAPDDYGMLSLITTLFSFTLPVISLGTTSAISVAFFRETKSDYASYLSSALLIPMGLTVFLIILLTFSGNLISNAINVPIKWLISIPLFAFFSIISSTLLINYQIQQKAYSFGVYSLSNSIFNIGISLLLVVYFKMNYEGRLIGQYLSITIFSLIAIVILYKEKLLTYKISKKFIRDAFIFGIPIVPHVIGGLVINMSDKLFINQMLGRSELGIYNTGFAIGSIISIINTSFANAIVPFSYQQFEKGDDSSKRKVVLVYWLYSIVLLFAVIGISLISPYIFQWFIDVRYSNGIAYVKWIAFGYYFQGIYLLFANIIYYTKRTKVLLYLSFVNIIINTTSNILLIRHFGSIGAAYTLCISYFLFTVFLFYVCERTYPLPWFNFLKIKQ